MRCTCWRQRAWTEHCSQLQTGRWASCSHRTRVKNSSFTSYGQHGSDCRAATSIEQGYGPTLRLDCGTQQLPRFLDATNNTVAHTGLNFKKPLSPKKEVPSTELSPILRICHVSRGHDLIPIENLGKDTRRLELLVGNGGRSTWARNKTQMFLCKLQMLKISIRTIFMIQYLRKVIVNHHDQSVDVIQMQ